MGRQPPYPFSARPESDIFAPTQVAGGFVPPPDSLAAICVLPSGTQVLPSGFSSIDCRCRDCQRTTGTVYAPTMAVPRDWVKITRRGAAYYNAQSDSRGKVGRHFCPERGSGVASKLAANPDAVGLKAASLDDPSWFGTAIDICSDSGQPWDAMTPDLPKVPKSLEM